MIALFVVLIVLPQDRLRGAAVRNRERYTVPTVRKAVAWGAALLVIVYMIRLLMVESAITTLTLGMSFAIIALSLTLLTGYAGEMNLAVVSFGAISTIVAYHFGTSGSGLATRLTLWGLIIGTLVAAVIGGLVALPALRLRGLYLALATMAFGVFLSNMVLRDTTEHELFGVKFSLFTGGSLSIPPLKVGPLDLSNQTAFLMTVTAIFTILAIGVVALRNSGYGRRLAAMKDSPAAAAMLGQNLVKLKLSVFMLSAGIAGLGGILMSSAIGAVSNENFSIMISLTVLMLTVVAGIGYVTGALFGGLMAGVGFAVIMVSFNNLGAAQPELEGLWTFMGHLAAVSPALIGLGVGKNPSGTVHDVLEGYRHLRSAKPVLVGGAAVVALSYVLALTGVLGNWWFRHDHDRHGVSCSRSSGRCSCRRRYWGRRRPPPSAVRRPRRSASTSPGRRTAWPNSTANWGFRRTSPTTASAQFGEPSPARRDAEGGDRPCLTPPSSKPGESPSSSAATSPSTTSASPSRAAPSRA